MKRPPSQLRKSLAWLGLMLSMISTALAQNVVYDNTTTYSHNAQPLLTDARHDSAEMGDEVLLGGTDRIVVELKLRFWYYGTMPGKFDARIRFRTLLEKKVTPGPAVVRDGKIVGYQLIARPGPPLYESALNLGLAAEPGMNEYTFKIPRIKTPDRFVWTIQAYNGAGLNGICGPAYYNPPTVGSSEDFFWHSDMGSSWIAYSWGSMPYANFGARILAVSDKKAVPKPPTANRQPPTANRQPPTANRQPPTANR